MTPLERVTERVMCNGNPEDQNVPTPLLTLEEFFEGNDEVGSIGCNLDEFPHPSEFRELLTEIEKRDDVSDIRIQITCVDSPGEEWPFSDVIWIMTSADSDKVRTWFPDRLVPDETWTGWTAGIKFENVELKSHHQPVAVWYD